MFLSQDMKCHIGKRTKIITSHEYERIHSDSTNHNKHQEHNALSYFRELIVRTHQLHTVKTKVYALHPKRCMRSVSKELDSKSKWLKLSTQLIFWMLIKPPFCRPITTGLGVHPPSHYAQKLMQKATNLSIEQILGLGAQMVLQCTFKTWQGLKEN